jgi:hypothetical protein
VLKDNFANGAAVGWAHIVRMIFYYLVRVGAQPIFAIGVTFASMNMRRFVSFIGVKEEPPPTNG